MSSANVALGVTVDGESLVNSTQVITNNAKTVINEPVPAASTITIDAPLKPAQCKLLVLTCDLDVTITANVDVLNLKAGIPYIFRDGAYETLFTAADHTSFTVQNADASNAASFQMTQIYDPTA